MRVTVSDPSPTWNNQIKSYLESKSYIVSVSQSGQECLKLLRDPKLHTLILNLDIQGPSGLEILKECVLNHANIRIILLIEDQSRLKELDLTLEKLNELGAYVSLIKPFVLEDLGKVMENDVIEVPLSLSTPPIKGADSEFTRIKLDTFYQGHRTVLPYYVRLSAGTYVQVLSKGEVFDARRIPAPHSKETYLYFRISDRMAYVKSVNALLTRSMASNALSSKSSGEALKSVTDKYVEEIYMSGLQPELVHEARNIADNMFRLLNLDKGLSQIFRQLEELDEQEFSHLFLTSLFSVMICKNLDWNSERTMQTVALASLLHDVGKLSLKPETREKDPKDMTPEEILTYHEHPRLGMEMLVPFPSVTEPVRQIIYQHHELVNGEGFPNKLKSSKIYPLAKIVTLANEFSSYLMEKKIAPLAGLREILTDRELILRYDPMAVKSLVASFAKEK